MSDIESFDGSLSRTARRLAMESLDALAGLVTPSGRFLYRYDSDSRVSNQGYNILRHCGCIWALNAAQHEADPDGRIEAASARAVDWLIEHCVRPVSEGRVCVVERDAAKLGGASLAVTALLTLAPRRRAPLHGVISQLTAYILGELDSDTADFVHKRHYPTGQVEAFRSAYYTGQALFALVRASDELNEADVLDVAVSALKRLVQQEHGLGLQSHWMMYAVHAATELRPDPMLDEYARRFLQCVIADDRYRARGECTPIACRTEAALLVADMACRPCTTISSNYMPAMLLGAANIRQQLRHRLADGSFKRGDASGEVRIDYIQHNAMSLLRYYHLACAAEVRPARRPDGRAAWGLHRPTQGNMTSAGTECKVTSHEFAEPSHGV